MFTRNDLFTMKTKPNNTVSYLSVRTQSFQNNLHTRFFLIGAFFFFVVLYYLSVDLIDLCKML